jgi:GT2 family glycosyltransferase
MIRRTAWEQVGSLDEQLFWVEDADWALRAQQQGWHLAYLPHVSVTHMGEASAQQDLYVKVSRQHLNKLDYFGKHGTVLQQAVVRGAIFLVALGKICVRAVQCGFMRQKEACLRVRAYSHIIGVVLGLRREHWGNE